MLDDGNGLNLTPAPPSGAESSNRTFIAVAGILAAIVLISLGCMAVYALVYLPSQNAQRAQAQATGAQNFLTAQAAGTQTVEASLWTPTTLPSPQATDIASPSPTPVVALATVTSTLGSESRDPTAEALQAQAAGGPLTPGATIEAALAETGFVDDIGIPGLVLLGIVFIVIILLARRLRSAPLKTK